MSFFAPALFVAGLFVTRLGRQIAAAAPNSGLLGFVILRKDSAEHARKARISLCF
jgi:hypothetical protein